MPDDLRSWKAVGATQIPADVELDVLASDPWTGNVWVGWRASDSAMLRAMTHESALEYVGPARRKCKVTDGN